MRGVPSCRRIAARDLGGRGAEQGTLPAANGGHRLIHVFSAASSPFPLPVHLKPGADALAAGSLAEIGHRGGNLEGAIELLLGAERIMRDRVVADARQSHAERCPDRKNVELDRPFVAGHLAGWWRRSGRQCHQAGDRTRCGRLSDQDPLRPNCFIPFAVVALQRLSMTRQALTRAFMVATFAVASARLRSQPGGIAGSGRAAGAARSANAKAVGTTSPANQRKACTKRLSMADLRDYPLGRAE